MLRCNVLFACVTLLVVTACGEKRPLIAPKDIPAHQEKLRQKREKFKDDAALDDGIDASNASTNQDGK